MKIVEETKNMLKETTMTDKTKTLLKKLNFYSGSRIAVLYFRGSADLGRVVVLGCFEELLGVQRDYGAGW